MADPDPQIELRNYPGYDEDFGAWLDAQAGLLREARFAELDIGNLIEEVEGVAKSNFRSLLSALELILLHMMKWDYQVERQGRSWRTTINTQRKAVQELLEESPSYRRRVPEAIERAYRVVPDLVEDATTIPASRLPKTCPFSWDEIMNRAHDINPDRPWPN